jgi:hypothetical protein
MRRNDAKLNQTQLFYDEVRQMRVSEHFKSKYLKSADLQGRKVTRKIEKVTSEEIGELKERKLVCYFSGEDRGLILNLTNGTTLAAAFGDECNQWPGHPVELFTEGVIFQGKRTEGLRVRPLTPTPRIDKGVEGLDDDINF